ncbi:MAG TPA: PH domain-containing protein [Anaeromyxobacter sp.]|nr:PH domain-containing protein [Anaeromyxobacter sp.]
MRRFNAPWDRALLLSTVALLAVILFTAIAGTSMAVQAGMRGVALAVAVFAGGTAVGSWALAPRAYEIGGGTLRILRNGWLATAVPLARIRSAGEIEPDALRGSLRLVGIGGLFGTYGLFRSPELGPFRLDATRATGLVLVRTPRRAHVLTPDRPDEFVEALLAASPSAQRERRRSGARR